MSGYYSCPFCKALCWVTYSYCPQCGECLPERPGKKLPITKPNLLRPSNPKGDA